MCCTFLVGNLSLTIFCLFQLTNVKQTNGETIYHQRLDLSHYEEGEFGLSFTYCFLLEFFLLGGEKQQRSPIQL